MKKINFVANLLLFIGAINWGLIGLFDVNLVHMFIENESGDRFLYSLIGFSALYKVVYWKSIRYQWKEE